MSDLESLCVFELNDGKCTELAHPGSDFCFYHLISFPTERLAGELAVKNEPRPKIVAEIRDNENNSSALAGFTLAILKLIGYSLAFTLQAGFAGVAMIAGLALAAVSLYLLVAGAILLITTGAVGLICWIPLLPLAMLGGSR